MNTKIPDISPEDMKYPNPKVITVIVILLCFISRVPQLASPYLLLDGDECVVGLMAKHIYSGKELPLFFWGQQYGFTLIECLVIVPFYAVLGMSTIAVKLAMLSLWSIGVVFLYKTLQLLNKGNSWIPFLLILVFIWHPAWAVWAMKARGGYITAFTLSNIILYLSFNDKYNARHVTYAIIGILSVIIYESQPLWLTGILPLVAYKISKPGKRRYLYSILISAVPLLLSFFLYKNTLYNYYTPPVFIPGINDILPLIGRIPVYLYHSLHGNYFFSIIQPPNFFCATQSIIFECLVFGVFIAGIYYSIFNKKDNYLFICSILFVPLCLMSTLFSEKIHGRYLLPVSGFLLIPLQLFFNGHFRHIKILGKACIAFIAMGVVSLITFWNFHFMEKELVYNMINYFKRNHIQYVYSVDWMLPWQIAFYSNEQITLRMPYRYGRYKKYNDLVDGALNRNEKIGCIGYLGDIPRYKLSNLEKEGEHIYGIGPRREELELYDFIFQ